jgi:hypothetical protein
MKLANRGVILAGIVVFLILLSFPFWYGRGKTAAPPDLRLDTPAIEALPEKLCVAPAEFMRTDHMRLLADWRDGLREGQRDYTAGDGRRFSVSLTGTCLKCHDNKEQFCDRCHDYTGVKPNCWSCHIIPKEVR